MKQASDEGRLVQLMVRPRSLLTFGGSTAALPSIAVGPVVAAKPGQTRQLQYYQRVSWIENGVGEWAGL